MFVIEFFSCSTSCYLFKDTRRKENPRNDIVSLTLRFVTSRIHLNQYVSYI